MSAPVVHTRLPASEEELRKLLYAGELFLLLPTAATRTIVQELTQAIDRELGLDGPARDAQFRFSEDEFFRRVGRLRKLFYSGEHYQDLVRAVISECGGDPAALGFDPLRLRAISHLGHENPRAAPLYSTHRDTWYANPQSQITWWIPLHDVQPEETFVFHTECFARPVSNDSAAFDHDAWTAADDSRKIGWQHRDTGLVATYPALRESVSGASWTFEARAGQLLLFSGQHLHGTTPNLTGRTRFSADFRTAHLGDVASDRGAPNVDNRSRGSTVPTLLRSPANGRES